jgi:hypothetical protein
MSTEVDASYVFYLDLAKKPYMMPVSPFFYTNLPGQNKNWLWTGDHLWNDRWNQVWFEKPEFVEIITWNDYGESSYVGPLDSRQVDFFGPTLGNAPLNYTTDMPHEKLLMFLPYLIQTYKNDIASVSQEGIQTWYRINPNGACGDGGTTGNTASHGQTIYKPSEMLEDKIFYSALLGSKDATVTITIGDYSVKGDWSTTPDGGVGIYHGRYVDITSPFANIIMAT